MIVRPFTDEYESVAEFVCVAPAELRRRESADSLERWIAVDGDAVTGVVTARRRPDGRTFLAFGETPPPLFSDLAAAASSRIGTVYGFARDEQRRAELTAAGFEVEITLEQFSVSFGAALHRLRRARLPGRYRLGHVDEFAEASLVALDNRLRQDVPGSDGWEGTIDMWRAEIAGEEYDRSGYLIAVDAAGNQCCGIARMWRNPQGPRLGLLAVDRGHRGGFLAAALLRAALMGAAAWGHAEFTTETSQANATTYPALVRSGARSLGKRYQLVLGPLTRDSLLDAGAQA